MKVKGKIKMIGETRSGVNQWSGNAWVARDVMLELEGESGLECPSVVMCTAGKEDVVRYLDQCGVGEEVDCVIRIGSQKRTSQAGREYWVVGVALVDVKLVNEGF